MNFVIQVSILVGGEVCVEFLKRKDGCDRVVEVQRISQDGMKVGPFSSVVLCPYRSVSSRALSKNS